MRKTYRLLLSALALAGCDAGPRATAPTTHADRPAADAAAAAAGAKAAAAPKPVPLVGGKPIWSSNRRYSAEENARSHFERDGADFGAATVEDFVAKAHAFTTRPPKGVAVLTRANGDRLLYDETSNTFAVVTRSGAPRTMFKPRDGADYWRRQVRIEADRRDH